MSALAVAGRQGYIQPMGNAPFSGDSTLPNGTDALTPEGAERRHRRTLRALGDVDAGRLIDDEAMQAWAESLGTDRELPVPKPG